VKKDSIFNIRFAVSRPIASVPHIISCGEEVRYSASYNLQGKYRQQDLSIVFQYTISGSGVFKNKDGEYLVPAGSGFLCRVSDSDMSYYLPEDAKQPWHFQFFSFLGSSLFDTVDELTSRYGPIFSIPGDNPVIERMMNLMKRNEYQMAFSESAGIAARFLNLLFQITEIDNDEDAPELELVRSAKNHIQQYLLNNLNAGEVARALNVSREHLSRIFSREAGITLYQYILREKVLHACHLLKDTNMSSKEISIELGFDQPSHFSRTFLRIIKLTPRSFRQFGTMPIFPA
jgi:AraC-like DNA-binding protein